MSVELTSIEIRSPEVTDRTHAKLMALSMYAIAQNHRLVTMGKHFKNNAETAPGGPYGYAKRGEIYTRRKLKRFGTDAPNVRTGALMRATRNNSVISKTQYMSRLTIKAPSSWKAKKAGSRSGLNEQRRKELEAITRQENVEATELGNKTYQTLVNKPGNRRLRKKRVS